MEGSEEAFAHCVLEVFRKGRAPNFSMYLMAYEIKKKKVVTLILEVFLLFVVFSSHFHILGCIELWTFRFGDNVTFRLEHEVS